MSSEQLPIIIDCDPGQDDAINLLLAMSVPERLEIIGITTVAGNVPLPLTQRNARLICDIAARRDIPVFAGCDRPLKRALVTAENVHGVSGIDGIEIRAPRHPLATLHAVDFIVEALHAAARPITIVATGPLTNVAAALRDDPTILPMIERIVLMGGARREAGNFSPSAEFNMVVDPHAADVVFRCGAEITVIGLDVTYQALATPARRDRFRAIDNPAARATVAMLDSYTRHDTRKFGFAGAPLHDPCTVAFLLDETLFAGKVCNLTVEVDSTLTLGHTAVDFWHVTERSPNVTWMHSIDADGFYALLVDCIARY